MAFDYKKEYKEFYLPKDKPSIVTVPAMNYIAVRGKGDPNAEDGEYKEAIGLLYGIAFTIKMSKKGSHQIEGYFDYVVPPLEGFWWQEGVTGVDYTHKENFENRAWLIKISYSAIAHDAFVGYIPHVFGIEVRIHSHSQYFGGLRFQNDASRAFGFELLHRLRRRLDGYEEVTGPHLDVLGIHGTALHEFLQFEADAVVQFHVAQGSEEVHRLVDAVDQCLFVEVSDIKVHLVIYGL